MTGTDKPSKPTKLNTHRHKKRVRKNIDKKKKAVEKKNKERFGDVSGGTKVIQRATSDVNRAPAYRAERLTKGGFHSTFPIVNHVDKVNTLEHQLKAAVDAQANIDMFAGMFKQIDGGQLAHASDEQKKVFAELHINQKLRKAKQEIDAARNESLRIALDIGADAFQDGAKKQQMKTQPQLQNLAMQYDRDIKNEQEMQKTLENTLSKKIERKRLRKQIADLNRHVYEEINDMHPPPPKETAAEKKKREELIARDKENFKRNPELFFADMVKQGETLLKQQKELDSIRDAMKNQQTSIKTFEDRKREIESLKHEDPRVTGEMINILRKKGTPEQMLKDLRALAISVKKKTDTHQRDYDNFKKVILTAGEVWKRVEKEEEALRDEMVNKLKSDEYWNYISPSDQHVVDTLELEELTGVYQRATDTMIFKNKEERERVYAELKDFKQKIREFDNLETSHRFYARRLEDIRKYMCQIENVMEQRAYPEEYIDLDELPSDDEY